MMTSSANVASLPRNSNSGARICDPQQLCSPPSVLSNSVRPSLSTGCGSQSRAPVGGSTCAVVIPKCYKKLAQTKGKLFNRAAIMTRQTPLVRIGVIGCGNVLSAYRATIDKLRLRGLAGVIAACGRESQRAAAHTELGGQRFTTDAREVITAPDVDLVVS